jgi:peptide-methionine (S)-S-oxide reductase
MHMFALLAMPNACLLHVACTSALRPALRPAPRMMTAGSSRELSTVVFGMGCFWAPQEAFESVPGVESARVGYASVEPQSSAEAPSYFSVCEGNGYTEAVEVTFDENIVSFESLLKVFWSEHDASVVTPGKEDQYRSALWVTNAAQRKLAISDLERATAAYAEAGKPRPETVVTESPPAFSLAENYHQSFWRKARLKLGVLVVLLLLRAAGSSELDLVSAVGTQLVFAWWWVECAGLLAAASPFAELF